MRCPQIKTWTVKLSSFTRLQTAFPLKKKIILSTVQHWCFPFFCLSYHLIMKKKSILASNTDAAKADSSICGQQTPAMDSSSPAPTAFHSTPADAITTQIKKRSPAAETAATLGYFKIESILSMTGIFLQLLLLSSGHLPPPQDGWNINDTVPTHDWHVLSLHLRTGATKDIRLISVQMWRPQPLKGPLWLHLVCESNPGF